MTLRRCSPRDNNRPQANWRWVLVVCQQKMVPTNFEQRPNEHPLVVVAEVATPHRLSGPVGLYPLAAFDNHIGYAPPDSIWQPIANQSFEFVCGLRYGGWQWSLPPRCSHQNQGATLAS
jgi:hypothetical protein